MKFKKIEIAVFAALTSLTFLMGGPAQAAPPPSNLRSSGTSVNAIHITGLDSYAGKVLNVFYVAGSPQAFGVRGEVLYVSAILQSPVFREEIPSNGEILIPATRVHRLPFIAYNNVLFAISDAEPDPLFLRNPDDSKIKDPRLDTGEDLSTKPDSDFKGQRIGFISSLTLNHLTRTGGVIQLDAIQDLRQ